MPKVVAYDDVKAGTEYRTAHKAEQWRTWFMKPQKSGVARDPYAFLSVGSPGRTLRPHFHRIDQFQVVVGGDGLMGRHKISPNAVHFAQADTPYGPLVGGEKGLSFLTLRSMGDPSGRHRLPEAMDELRGIPNRQPWQFSEFAQFDSSGQAAVQPFEHIKDERGLAAFSVRLEAGAQIPAPDPAQSDGQYIVVTQGSLMFQDKENKPITLVFVWPDEEPFLLKAGPEGLQAVVLNFPVALERGVRTQAQESHAVS